MNYLSCFLEKKEEKIYNRVEEKLKEEEATIWSYVRDTYQNEEEDKDYREEYEKSDQEQEEGDETASKDIDDDEETESNKSDEEAESDTDKDTDRGTISGGDTDRGITSGGDTDRGTTSGGDTDRGTTSGGEIELEGDFEGDEISCFSRLKNCFQMLPCCQTAQSDDYHRL